MQLNPYERDLFLDLAFFAEDTGFLGHELRPLSLASFKAMGLMGLTVLNAEHQLDAQSETREVAAFIWLHQAPLADVCAALWSGSWRDILTGFDAPLPEIVNAFRAWRTRLRACLDASDLHIRPRPKPEKDTTPRDVIGPTNFAFTVGMVANFTGLPPATVKWLLFLPEAMQYFHVAMRWNGAWTVRRGREAKEEDFADMLPDFLKPEPQ